MRATLKTHIWASVYILLFLIFALPISAQRVARTPVPQDTAINPHDFTNKFYAVNGINAKEIIGRRTGTDLLSVFGWSSNPDHTNIRVIATIPGYDQNGLPVFWYPLGEIGYDGFTGDEFGVLARQTAQISPIYVFPDRNEYNNDPLTSGRQSPLFDNSFLEYAGWENPVGIRHVIHVYYMKKAFSDDEQTTMDYFKKKNGVATDGTAMIKTLEDVQYLLENEFIGFETNGKTYRRPEIEQYVLAPIMQDPTKGVIAGDAFLFMTTVGGVILPSEEIFGQQFNCLKKSGDWCF